MNLTEMPAKASFQAEPSLMLVNGQITTYQTLILSDEKIAEMHVHKKGTPEAKKHDPKGEKNVALLSTKPGTELVKYEQILDQFNIPASERNRKVSINRTALVNPELILADLSEIEKVEVTEAGAREFAQWGWNPGDKFLNIITKKQE